MRFIVVPILVELLQG